eukprot:jgi/Psemu1/316623/fgenesh1_kg.3661_\
MTTLAEETISKMEYGSTEIESDPAETTTLLDRSNSYSKNNKNWAMGASLAAFGMVVMMFVAGGSSLSSDSEHHAVAQLEQENSLYHPSCFKFNFIDKYDSWVRDPKRDSSPNCDYMKVRNGRYTNWKGCLYEIDNQETGFCWVCFEEEEIQEDYNASELDDEGCPLLDSWQISMFYF